MSLLMICFEDLSIFDNGVLKSPTIIVLLSISFLTSLRFSLCIWMLLCWVNIYLQCLWLLGGFFPWVLWSDLLGPFLWPFFEVYFVWYEYCYPSLFSCPFAWKICFQPFTFSLCRSLVLRWVSCRQHICGSWILIHSVILCHFVGAFNSFAFKVIIDKYLFIAIFSLLYLYSSLSISSFS